MKTSRLPSGIRGRALLAAFLIYAFGLLPFLAASHSHAEEVSHASCQLCQVSSQAYQAASPALAPNAAEPVSHLLPGDSRRAQQILPAPYESRGPPSA